MEISTDEFYERLKISKVLPTTSAPPPGDFERAYQELLQTHAGIVSIHLPGSLSATYSGAVAAARRVAPDRIVVIEGGHCSLGLGWLAERGLAEADQTNELPDIADAVRALIPRIRLFVALDTLEFLQRGGRIGRVAALAGALLNVKPLLKIEDGQVLPVERVRSRGAALRRLRELTLEQGRLERIAVIEGDGAEAAAELVSMLSPSFPGIEIERGDVSPVVGVHGGPGIVAVVTLVANS